MPKTPIIHKIGKQTTEQYAGFGQYVKLPVPLCVSASFIWIHKKQMYQHRLWKYVTCKHCLKIKNKQNEQQK